MPMYEHHCGKCRKDFEELVMGNARVKCPKCGNRKVKKLMSACAHTSGGKFTSAHGGSGSGCGSCGSHHCSTCGH